MKYKISFLVAFLGLLALVSASLAPCNDGNCCQSSGGYECCSNCSPGKSAACGVNGSGRPWCECRGHVTEDADVTEDAKETVDKVLPPSQPLSTHCFNGRNQCSQKSSRNECVTNCGLGQSAYCGINGSGQAWCECRNSWKTLALHFPGILGQEGAI